MLRQFFKFIKRFVFWKKSEKQFINITRTSADMINSLNSQNINSIDIEKFKQELTQIIALELEKSETRAEGIE